VIQPGDTIWLAGGTYTPPNSNGFIFQLNGTASAAIWVRNIKVPPPGYTGQLNPDGSERVILNGNGQNFPNLSGSYTTLEGLELTDLTTQAGHRYLTNLCAGCPPSLYPPAATAMEVAGTGNRVIHCVAHDNAAGIYSYASGVNSEIYGNISYYNGYLYGSEGLGHGFYLQNTSGNKWVTNNFAGDNVDNGFQIYGSNGAVMGFLASGNASYDNGSLAAWQYNLVVGSAGGTNQNSFDSFYTFFPLSLRNGYVTIGQYDPIANISDTDNVFVGGYTTMGSMGIGSPATITGNKLVNVPSNTAGAPSAMVIFAQFSNQSPSGITWNNNQYYGGPDLFYTGSYDGNNLSNGMYSAFPGWQNATGFDSNSTFTPTLPTGAWVYVLPDKYTSKRANIIVYNWNAYADQQGDIQNPCTGACASVSVDLSSILSPGDTFTIQDAQNWFGAPVLTGTYTGGTISIPMTGLGPKPVPWGLTTAPAHTAPAYGTFVVFSSNSADIAQPGQSSPSSSGGSGSSSSSSGSQSGSSSSSSSAPASAGATAEFTIGQTVAVNSITSPASLRSQGVVNASVTGTEPNGAVGTVVGGPNPIPATGTAQDILWQVQFSNSTGWIWQSLLVASSATPSSGSGSSSSGSSSTASAKLSINTTTLPAGQVGTGYSDAMIASEGTGPYSFSGTGFSAGLSISSGGLVSGTPSQAGSFTVALTVTDSTGASASTTLSLLINSSPNTTSTLPSGSVYALQSVVGSGQSVSAGQVATFSFTLNSASVSNETVGLSCAVAPAAAQCSVSEPTFPLSGSPQQFTVNVTTQISAGVTLPTRLPPPPPESRFIILAGVGLSILFLMGGERRKYWGSARLVGSYALLVLAVVAMAGMMGCGTTAAPGNANTSTAAQTSTPSGSYMLTITATPSIAGNPAQTIQVPFSIK
jgi:hypothetical protein